jgi:hypothetical protein
VTEGAQLGCESTILLLGVGRSRCSQKVTSASRTIYSYLLQVAG